MAEAGSATFRAIADFSRLRREAKEARRELDRMKSSASGADKALAAAEKRSQDAAKVLEASQRSVQRQSDALVEARRKEADAAGKVRTSEQQLADLRERGTATTTQLVAAEERHAKAQRDLAAAQRVTARRSADVEAAQRQLTRASSEAEQAQVRLAAAHKRAGTDTDRHRSSMRSAARDTDRLGESAEQSRGRLARLAQMLGSLGGRRRKVEIEVEVDTKRLKTTLAGITSLLKATFLAASVAPLIGAVTALAAGLVSITSAAAGAAGAVGALGGLAGAVGQGAAALMIGFSGIGDAVKELSKANEQMAALPPSGKRFAAVIAGEMLPALYRVRNAVQDALLPRLEEPMRRLLVLAPLVTTKLTETAGIIGELADRGSRMATSWEWQRDIGTIADSNNRALSSLGEAALDMADAARHVWVAVGPVTERFADWIERTAELGKGFVAARRETGQLQKFFDKAGDTAAQLGRILGNLSKAIFNVGKASAPAGQQLLDSFEKATQRFDEWTGSVKGQNALRDYFNRSVPAVKEFGGLLVDVVKMFGRLGASQDLQPLIAKIRNELLPAVEKFLANFGGEFANQLVELATKVVQIFDKLSANGALEGFLSTLSAIADVLNTLLSIPGVAPFVGSVLALAGAGAALGVVAGALGRIGGALGKLVKFTGLSSLLGLGKAKTDAADLVDLIDTIDPERRSRTGVGGGKSSGRGTSTILMPDIDLPDAERKGKAAGKAAQRGMTGGMAKGFGGKIGAIVTGALSIIPRLGVWGLVIAAVVGIGYAVYQNWDSIKQWTIDAWGAVSTWTTDTWNSVSTWVTTKATEARDGVAGAFTQARDWVVTKSTEARDGAVGAYTTAKDWVVQRATSLRDGVVGAFTTARDWTVQKATEARDWVAGAYETARLWVTDKANAAANGVREGYARARDWATNHATQARDWVAGAYEDAKNWVADKANRAADAASSAYNRARNAVSDAAGRTRDAAGSAFERLRDRVAGAAESARSRASSAFESLKSAASDAWSHVSRKVSDIGASISSVASRGWNWATSWFSTGGWVGGTGNKDTVHGMLTPDEYVVRQERARQWGPLLETINSSASTGSVLRAAAVTAGSNTAGQLLSRAAGGGEITTRIASAAPLASPALSGAGGVSVGPVSVTQNVYNPAPETPSESLTRRMRRAAEQGLHEAIGKAG